MTDKRLQARFSKTGQAADMLHPSHPAPAPGEALQAPSPAGAAAPSSTWQVWRQRLSGGLSSRPEASVEQLVMVASLFWALAANGAFFAAALRGQPLGDGATWRFALALALAVLALHALLLGLVCNRWTVKPLLGLLALATAAATFYMGAFGIYLDPTMLRNLLRTNPAEAGELITPALALHMLLYAGLPMALLWRVRVVHRPWRRAALVRLALLLGSLAVLLGAVLAQFQPLASLMRNHRELRYLITPANYLWSTGAVLAADARGAARPRQAIGLDAQPGPSWATRSKPMLVVLVVGETARAANWGLNAGFQGMTPRDTTPELARLRDSAGLVNFGHVSSCGTNTETSLPCMFAPVGRRDYDEDRIRGQESLLHVLTRAGVQVQWSDNQSGCKGVCDGLPNDTLSADKAPGLCPDGRCLDEGLLHELDRRLAQSQAQTQTQASTQLLVLHMIGSHGPSYFRRYPPAFARFQPACQEDDLRRCSIEQVRNAYDNSLLYTDHVLAAAIAKLRAHEAQVDSALIYVSDHGESLGEHGLFLHGVPYAIAPEVQTRVPMVAWTSSGLDRARASPAGCSQAALQRQSAQPLSHDHLFHTLMGLLDVRSALYEAPLDLLRDCRAGGARP